MAGEAAHSAWYPVRANLGQVGGYIEDLERALALVQQQSCRHQERGEPIVTLGQELRLGLILVSVNDMANSIPSILIEGLVRERLWRPATALACIRRMHYANRRKEALLDLAGQFTGELLQEALDIACNLGDTHDRIDALCGLAPYISEPASHARLWEAALAAVPASAQPSYTLYVLAPQLPDHLLPEALTLVRGLADPSERTSALGHLAVYLPMPDLRFQVMEEALATSRAIVDPHRRLRTLSEFVNVMTLEQLQEVLAVARNVPYHDVRAEAILEIMPHLPDLVQRLEAWTEALTVAGWIDDPAERLLLLHSLISVAEEPEMHALALAALQTAQEIEDEEVEDEEALHDLKSAPGDCDICVLPTPACELPRPTGKAALQSALQCSDASERREAFRAIALTRSADHLQEALEAARAIGDAYQSAEALGSIAFHLIDPLLRQQILAEALVRSRPLPDACYRNEALHSISSYLTSESLPEFPEASGADQTPLDRMLALLNTPSCLPETILPHPNWKEDLAAARQIADPLRRVEALCEILPHLPDAGRRDRTAATILAAIREINLAALCSLAFQQAIPHLTAGHVPEVLEMAFATEDPLYRCGVFCDLAPYLSQEQLQRVLTDIGRIDKPFLLANTLGGLAPSLASDLRQVALHMARSIPDIAARAEALRNLAAHWPDSPTRIDLWWEALNVGRRIDDLHGRGLLLCSVAPHLPDPTSRALVWAEALDTAPHIRISMHRMDFLRDIVPHLATVSPDRFCALWQTLLRMVLLESRADLYRMLPAMAPVLLAKGGEQALSEVIQALHESAR